MAFWNKTNKETIITPTGNKVDDVFVSASVINSLKWDGSDIKFLKDYLEVPEVASIINIKARAFANMRIKIVSNTTGEEVKNNEPIVRALRNPNYFQAQKEFLIQTKIFREVFGNEIIYFLTPTALSRNIKGMFSLPPLYVNVEELQGAKFWMFDSMPESVKYYIDWVGDRQYLNSADFVHINDPRINITSSNTYWGASKLGSLQAPISNIRAAYEARNVLIENRGALGILTNNGEDVTGGAVPLDAAQKKDLQKEYKKYGITKDQYQLIITSLNLKWQQMAIDADKLKLFEETKADTEQVCDKYGVPFELLANEKGTTFANRAAAQKWMYTNTIIPEAVEWCGAIDRHFEDNGGKSWHLEPDFSHLEIFADDMKERATAMVYIVNALSKAYADKQLTPEEYKRELRKLKIGL